MLGTVADESAFEPAVDGPVVELDIMVEFGLELIGVEELYGSFLPPGPDGPALPEIDLHVDHAVRERPELRVVVGGAVEDEVAGLELGLGEAAVREQVELVGLVPLCEGVAEVLAQVEHALPDEAAAVEKERGGVEGLVGLVVLAGVGHADVLLGSLDELLPQLIFKLWAAAVHLRLLQVLVQLQLVELLLLELQERLLHRHPPPPLHRLLVLLLPQMFHFTVISQINKMQISVGKGALRLKFINIIQNLYTTQHQRPRPLRLHY